jgi:PAS domain S-box-containing protein
VIRYPVLRDEPVPTIPDWKEEDRLRAVAAYEILDTAQEEDFDNIAILAAEICNAPIAVVNIIAESRQWFKAKVGLDVRETPLAAAICKHAILQRGLYVVPDIAKDPRFSDNPLVVGEPHLRFYAAAPLESPEGFPIGTLCILDHKPRKLNEKEAFTLKALARQVMIQLELRRSLKAKDKNEGQLRASELRYRRLFEAAQDGVLILDVVTGRIDDANPYLCELLGFTRDEMIGKTVGELSPFKDIESNQVMLERLQKHGYVRYEDLPLEKRDGGKIAVEFVSNVYRAGDHEVIQCNIRDITKAKATQEQLLWKTAFFEAQVNSAPDGILIVDSQGKMILQNQRMLDLWNFPQEFLDQSDDQERLDWVTTQVKNPEGFAHKVAYLYAHPNEVSCDEIELINGKIFDRYSAPVRGSDGKEYGRIWTFRDITERKVASDLRRITQARYRTLFEHAPDGILIADAEGYYIDGNASICRMLGLSHEELVGRHSSEIVAQSEIAQIDPALRAIKAKSDYHREWQFRRKDLTTFSAEVIATMMPDGNLLGMIRDITERKRTEARFRRLVDSNAQGVMFWSTKGGVTGANDAFLKMVSYTREDLEAGRIHSATMTPPEYAERDRQCQDDLLTKGVCGPYEKEYFRQDGSRVPVIVGVAAFEDNPQEGVCFVIDLTERKKLEQQFLRAQRMESIGTLAGGIAHDLNNILAPILMSIEILKNVSTHPDALKVLGTIEISAKRGADIVRQVLSFARGLEGERIEVQPKHLLNDLENIIKNTFPKDIRLRISVPNDTWTILGDPTQVNQILLNLSVNARDAMPHGGVLTIKVENSLLDEHYAAMNSQAKPGRYVKISVTDSGVGVPPDLLDKIFEPFFTTKEFHKGTGLGLSTVMAIVKSHEGMVNVLSELGKGSTFEIYLPAMDNASGVNQASSEESDLPRGNNELILVVDDETAVLAITGQTLEAFGYRVLTATDGADAVAVYAEHRKEIALVITDMMMPIMSGPATIQALLRIDPKIKIIAASGLTANGSGAKPLTTSIKHFLKKPYTAAALLQTLRTALDEN